ncbi:hypothetical protein BpHYR1_006818 [Brachionus plicatilis]|uniref:Uncharacterized protein n=1 Tax=Brachionus plicatilis TaxID=10195 RepID=A0A3M7S8M6_BRAPC|nr:hypothetical protein BpHYR1_006818 [Brachionus plicatilis]
MYEGILALWYFLSGANVIISEYEKRREEKNIYKEKTLSCSLSLSIISCFEKIKLKLTTEISINISRTKSFNRELTVPISKKENLISQVYH